MSNMRTKDGLRNIEDINILLIYLYGNKEHEVKIPGRVPGTWFRFRISDDFELEEDFLPSISGERTKWMGFRKCQNLSLQTLVAIIDNLKVLPPEKYKRFQNRWEEVSAITREMLSMTRLSGVAPDDIRRGNV